MKTYRMRYKEGEKEIASSRYIMSLRENRFKNAKKNKRQKKRRLKAVNEDRKKTRVWEKANGSQKRKRN